VPIIGGQRAETERFHRFGYDEIVARDKVSLDVFWLRDDRLKMRPICPSRTSWLLKSLKISRPPSLSLAKSLPHFAPFIAKNLQDSI